eukprot:TRINITY_DN10756_c0_g1_i1.p2 TRINITY_DN10756_c0_g1~~TRINITY_DN10756_c0_g1_i1.p2  ORF type:complete len:100 (-),score=7.63 TRINITY_DN10756_c0_g1_i1:294-593(-)
MSLEVFVTLCHIIFMDYASSHPFFPASMRNSGGSDDQLPFCVLLVGNSNLVDALLIGGSRCHVTTANRRPGTLAQGRVCIACWPTFVAKPAPVVNVQQR